MGRQVGNAVAGLRTADDLSTARWFETFRLSGTSPDQPDLSRKSRDRRADANKASLEAILAASTELSAFTASVRAFAAIMNEHRDRKLLEPRTNAAEATGEPALRSFHWPARRPGRRYQWAQPPLELRLRRRRVVNRIKMLKRQMYGRAGPDLLRCLVLLAD